MDAFCICLKVPATNSGFGIYLCYARNGGSKGQEFTRDQRYKLHGDRKFYDLSKDRLEKNPLSKQARKENDAIAYEKLAKVLSG